jgi:hypothetical protein
MFLLDVEFALLIRTADTEPAEARTSRLDPDRIGEAAVCLLAIGGIYLGIGLQADIPWARCIFV